MARPQLENGFLRLSNELAEALMRAPLNGSQWRILLAVLRDCYGRNGGRKLAPLSYGKIAAATGLELRTVQREVGRLLKSNVLIRETHNQTNLYGPQKDYSRWNLRGVGCLTVGQSADGESAEGESVNQPTELSVNPPTHKKKEESKKKESFAFAGKHLRLTGTQLQAFKDGFPNLDIGAAIRKADAWCVANPDRAPRKRHARFMNSWLSRERPGKSNGQGSPTYTLGELERMRESKQGEAATPRTSA